MSIMTGGGHKSGQDARGPKTSYAEKGVAGTKKALALVSQGFVFERGCTSTEDGRHQIWVCFK